MALSMGRSTGTGGGGTGTGGGGTRTGLVVGGETQVTARWWGNWLVDCLVEEPDRAVGVPAESEAVRVPAGSGAEGVKAKVSSSGSCRNWAG